jgi:hypothetical protein
MNQRRERASSEGSAYRSDVGGVSNMCHFKYISILLTALPNNADNDFLFFCKRKP